VSAPRAPILTKEPTLYGKKTMSPESESESESGKLFIDANGTVVHASGAASSVALQRELMDRFASVRRESVGAFTLLTPEPMLVTHRVIDDGTFFLLHPDPGQVPPIETTGRRGGDRRPPHTGLLRSSRGDFGLDDIVGSSEAIQQLKSDIAKVAPLHVPVLIVGESGTGKELAALAIHALSNRSENAMIVVNAAALPGGLVESELFGYEAGAFTGAERAGRKGKFELANRSSLFFDEVGDMPAEIQVKLLRVIQDGIFERVGGSKPLHSDFRLICASNRKFQQMISAGEFRLDLYYRISGVTIRMPSLRERLEDIPQLVRLFLEAFAARHRTTVKDVDEAVFAFLREQPWPGNVRQLLHEVERAAIFSETSRVGVEDFRRRETMMPLERETVAESAASPRTVRDAVDALEQTMIRNAMARHGGNKSKVAEELGISRAYLYKRLSSL